MSLVLNYLKYLRDVSRKIVFRSGFDNVLFEETSRRKHFYRNADNSEDKYSDLLIENASFSLREDETEFKQYLNKVVDSLNTNTDKPHELFIGLGLFKLNNGTTKSGKTKNIIAPLLYCITEIDIDDKNNYHLSLDRDSFQLNIDLLAKLMKWNITGEEDEDQGTISNEITYNDTLKLIDTIEGEIQLSINHYKTIDLKTLFEKLKLYFPALNTINYSAGEKFNYKSSLEEKNLFNNSENCFYEHAFFFIKEVPNELTTYEALKELIEQTENNKSQNLLLNKILENSLTKNRKEYGVFPEFEEYNFEYIYDHFPFSLSPRQKKALKTTWQNELTYIEGPPGTGKSYTIIALILSAFLLNKKVLFVSHKKAAIDIVRNQINKLLGNNSVISLGNNYKKTTKLSVEQLLNEVKSNAKDSYNKNAGNNLNLITKDLNDCIDNIHKSQLSISEDLKIENRYYKIHDAFLRKREYFESLKSDTNPLPNFREFSLSSSNAYNDKNITKAIFKYKEIEKKSKQSKQISRIDRLYQIKLLKHFKKEYKANSQILSFDSTFFEEIQNLFSSFSLSERIKKGVEENSFRLETNRHRLHLDIKRKNELAKKFLFNKFNFHIVSTLLSDKIAFDSLESYKKSLYWKAPERIKQNWESVNFKKLTSTFPIWCAELRDLNGSFPLLPVHFDLIIVDEASQVNIAEIIPAFYRGERFCIVGDKNQLHLDSVGVGFALSKNFDDFCWTKNGLNREIKLEDAKNDSLLVSRASILNFIDPSKRAVHVNEVILNEHFRSLPQLASFTSTQFYNNQWSIMTENAENIDKICFQPINVKGERDTEKKIIEAEVQKCIELLENLISDKSYLNDKLLTQFNYNNDIPTIGIISFLTDQRDELKIRIEKNFKEQDLQQFKVFIGTPEDFQGNERDIIIITLGLDGSSLQKAKHHQNPNRFNVATSRAKYFTYFIYAGIPENAFLLEKYLSHFNHKPSLLFKNDTKPEETNVKRWTYSRAKCDSEFELKVADYLESFCGENNNIKLYNQVEACGQKRLDFVLFNPDEKITCVVEVDGKDHFLEDGKNYTEEHQERVRVLETAGWKIVHIKYFNWYSKKGWLCDSDNISFKKEIENIFENVKNQLKIK